MNATYLKEKVTYNYKKHGNRITCNKIDGKIIVSDYMSTLKEKLSI